MSTAIGASFAARVERHHPELPVYLLVPAEIVIGFGRDATFVVEASVAGRAIGRRSIKPWGDGRWFMELTKAQCDRLGVGEGDRVEVDLRPAPELPAELEAALAARGLEAAWARLSAAERRALAEDVFAAKRPETRARRLQRALTRLEQAS
jgi:hypothetical protein